MKCLTLLCLSFFSLLTANARENSLLFIENVGQFTDQFHKPRPQIDFGLRSVGMNVFIEAGTIHYQFMKAETQEAAVMNFDPLYRKTAGWEILNIHRVDVELLGANKNVRPIKEGRLQYYERYYTPQFGEEGGTAYSYSRIIYKDVYPNIDWIIYINGEQVEYDFIVREGGDPADIRLQYNGVNSLSLDSKGNLTATTTSGNITEHMPVAWQEDGKRIAASFTLNDNVVFFNIAPHKGTLLIDPYIEWATYYGGAGYDEGRSIAEDISGNIYLSSTTFSASNIATVGAYDISYADSGDVYIAKFNGSGIRLWGTYFGGQARDVGGDITYDNQGHIYLSGCTSNSTGITTISSDQPVFSGPYISDSLSGFLGDAFLVKFDVDGNRLWGTYFGGNDRETGLSIKCDNVGNIYMTGGTYSTSNIATNGAHQVIKAGGSNNIDCFLVKFNGAGQKLWATYYGGSFRDDCSGLEIFQGNRIYVSGVTRSSDNIGTTGTYQSALPSSTSGFIAAFNENGSRLWGTYFGGNTSLAHTSISNITCNSNGDLSICGQTNDPSGISTPGCHQPAYAGDAGSGLLGDAFIGKIDNMGNKIWATYFGGTGGDGIGGIRSNQAGIVYVAGVTTSSNNIALNAIQPDYIGGGQLGIDGILAKFTDGGTCIWSTYLGGTGDDWLGGIQGSANNHVYVSGAGNSFPTTLGGHQPNFAGGMYDAYLAKLKDYPAGIIPIPSAQRNFTLYPSFGNGAFTIEGNASQLGENVSCTIININGQQVYTEQFKCSDITFSKKITLGAHLAQGMYIVNVVSGNNSYSQRYILQSN